MRGPAAIHIARAEGRDLLASADGVAGIQPAQQAGGKVTKLAPQRILGTPRTEKSVTVVRRVSGRLSQQVDLTKNALPQVPFCLLFTWHKALGKL